MKIKTFFFSLLLLSTASQAANDLNDWNGTVSKEIREKLNNDTTTYKTLSNVKATPEQSSAKYSDSAIKAGSKVGVTIEALQVPASKLDIAKTLVARHGKNVAKIAAGTVAGTAVMYVGEAAIRELINGIGWAMDEGAKITRPDSKPTQCKIDGSDCQHSKYIFIVSSYSDNQSIVGTIYSDTSAPILCSSLSKKTNNNSSTYLTSKFIQDSGNRQFYCLATMQAGNLSYVLSFDRYTNPNYNSSALPPDSSQFVSDSDFQQAIQDQLTNSPNSDLSNQLATDAYTIQDSSGKPTDSLSKADTDTGINQAANKMVDAAKSAISNDLNPQNAKLNSGSTGTANTDTSEKTKNEDGTTSETESKSSTSFQLPAFCDWASYVCEFIDWVKKEPEDTDDQDQQVEDDSNVPQIKTNTFKFNGQCPQPLSLPIPDPFGNQHELTYSFDTFCLWLSKLKPWVDVIGWILAIVILTGHRSTGDGS